MRSKARAMGGGGGSRTGSSKTPKVKHERSAAVPIPKRRLIESASTNRAAPQDTTTLNYYHAVP